VTAKVSDCHPMVVIRRAVYAGPVTPRSRAWRRPGSTAMRRDSQGAMPGRARQALVTVRLLSGHSANAPARGHQAVRSRQARAPRPSWPGCLPRRLGRTPCRRHAVSWYQVSARGATGPWTTSARWRPFTFLAASLNT